MCNNMDTVIEIKSEIKSGAGQVGQRLDTVAARMAHGVSRGSVSAMIRSGDIRVNGVKKKPGYRMKPGDVISGRLLIAPLPPVSATPMSMDIIHEDPHILVLNKPAGLVVHPAPGHWEDTLVNGLLAHCPGIDKVGGDGMRPGIVHRLDKDTSGIMVVAKTPGSHEFLKKAFKYRRMEKQYLALVSGEMDETSGTVTLPIGRHPVKRKCMAVDLSQGRPAITLWRKRARCKGATLVEVALKTGRTHQIRVHFKALGYPLVGDGCYGQRRRKKTKKNMLPIEKAASRQMLHAWRLGFRHPWSGRRMDFTAPLAPDMEALLLSHGLWDGNGESCF
ncbi:23S rRNA pseudouridine1911/1915/1917 synthase [Desulfocicer vacuolatum DSM 3385]|uniref:Pseudouridine synthase n=1 Tax=Desulfocicer vacuolatum DSM 3385 TaxID=1121400 RepID=A0A1W1YK03_9BACT|nr:RluA family pseudouridine synthase [Desulfocicer vacuolatum]SMC36484.1 23S rRNA pseudouridine1911/1915/1917 synthase [Desulfocicer vacuolatum DSM 3385]